MVNALGSRIHAAAGLDPFTQVGHLLLLLLRVNLLFLLLHSVLNGPLSIICQDALKQIHTCNVTFKFSF